MTAPTAPPVTSIAKTAAQVAALLAAGTAGAFDIYFDPGGSPDAGGYANATLLAALLAASPKALPVAGAVAYSAADLQAKLQESSPSGALWIYFHAGSASGEGIAASALGGTVVPLYTEATHQVIVFRKALIYDAASFAGTVNGTAAIDTIYTVDQARIHNHEGQWFKIKGGANDGDFLRVDDVHIGIIV